MTQRQFVGDHQGKVQHFEVRMMDAELPQVLAVFGAVTHCKSAQVDQAGNENWLEADCLAVEQGRLVAQHLVQLAEP